MSRVRFRGSWFPPMLVLCLPWLLYGCSAARLTPVGSWQPIEAAFKTIAMAPSGGVFADLIGIELTGRGYTVFDSGSTLALLMLLQKGADDPLSPPILRMLKQRGIDAVLAVQKVDGTDGLPQTVQIRLYSTDRLIDVGVLDWQNSWIRRSTLEAAQEIATAVGQQIQPSEPSTEHEPSVASTANPKP
jgi:hypothetical protein